MSASPHIRGLYDLYQEERRREEKTKASLRTLQENSDELLRSKMRLVEKVLDIKVKDELAFMRDATNVALVETSNEAVRRRARERIQRDVAVRLPEAKDKWGDHFVSYLEDMAERDRDAESQLRERRRVRQAVDNTVAPPLQRLAEQRHTAVQDAAKGGTSEIIEAECERVLQDGREALSVARRGRLAEEHENRRARVAAAEAKLLKPKEVTAAQLSDVLNTEPDPTWYDCPVGKSEAVINDWRNLIYRQRAEEERLILERSAQLNTMESEHEVLQQEVDALTQQVQAAQEELDTKEREIGEMREAQIPGSGRWARDLVDLEQSVEFQVDEELRLKRDYENIAAASGTIDADKRMLNEKVHDELEELARLQEQYQQLVDKIEEQLMTAKDGILGIRHENLENTRRINDLRWRAWSGSDEVQDRKRAIRDRLNHTISQLAIEERLLTVLEAKIQLKEEEMEMIQRDSHKALEAGKADLMRVKSEQEYAAIECTKLIDTLSDLKTSVALGDGQPRPVTKSEGQLKEDYKALTKQWGAMLHETAQSISETKAKTMMNIEENELLLDRMGHIVVTGQTLEREGADIEHSTTAQLAQVANRLYDDLARASFRESKMNQLLRTFREVQQRRAEGEVISQITGPRPQPRHERRSRREAKQRAWLAKEMAKANVVIQGAQVSPSPAPRADPAAVRQASASPGRGMYDRQTSAAPHEQTPEQQHRLRVINFIKSEIQPLYDSEQITKKRFIDIVARTSSAYLEIHPPSSALTPENQQWLQRKIQEVITLQDEARSRRRAQKELRERSLQAAAASALPPR
eukprot:TRINITY_DN35898_c0_g1_i1.p1 TRINITY_DN35898_c0_g1~~TRINITY_DN35898_c0_g1_i1.p1  ORF type:complete len:810 (+),score=365.46 TRINITY_DN35898_c0_g1_i1:58-2487(+)